MATDLQFIKSVTADNVTNIDIPDCFSDKYDVYKIFLTKTDLGTGFTNAWANMRVLKASDGTSDTTANYDSAGQMQYAYTSFGENRYTNSTQIVNTFSYSDTGSYNNGGEVTVYNPFDSGSYTFFTGQGANNIWTGSISSLVGNKSIAVHKVAQSNSGLQILIPDITTMVIKVYGVK